MHQATGAPYKNSRWRSGKGMLDVQRRFGGSLMAGEGRVAQVPGGTPPEQVPQILNLLRYQVRLTSSDRAEVVTADG